MKRFLSSFSSDELLYFSSVTTAATRPPPPKTTTTKGTTTAAADPYVMWYYDEDKYGEGNLPAFTTSIIPGRGRGNEDGGGQVPKRRHSKSFKADEVMKTLDEEASFFANDDSRDVDALENDITPLSMTREQQKGKK